MATRTLLTAVLFASLAISMRALAQPGTVPRPANTSPLVIGETFTITSRVLGEVRRINVYIPAGFAAASSPALPVMYMPDGGMAEDFLHVAGILQVSVGNGTMRPFLLVGIENTERRRDLTGPTTVDADRKIAPRVGGSAAFRQFVRAELMPAIKSRYRTTSETAIVGESLAGLFILETLLVEPDLFDTYIAFDPSLWWDDQRLVKTARQRFRAPASGAVNLFLANSGEPTIAPLVAMLADSLRGHGGIRAHHHVMPNETHGTIYHPAALLAFRTLFKPAEERSR